jgi:hypothetical protein
LVCDLGGDFRVILTGYVVEQPVFC